MKWYRSLCRRPGRIFQPHVSSSHLHVHIFRMENLPYFRSFCQCGRWKFILLWDVRGVCRFHIHLSAFILLHGLKPTDILLLDIICVYIYINIYMSVCMYTHWQSEIWPHLLIRLNIILLLYCYYYQRLKKKCHTHTKLERDPTSLPAVVQRAPCTAASGQSPASLPH